MLVAAQALIEQQPDASRDQIRSYMSGNYCRCTGYQAIVDAIESVMAQRKSEARA